MILDYVSDLHLEINNELYVSKRYSDPYADCLVLAGDIVTYNAIDPAKTDVQHRGIRKRFLKLLQTDWNMYKKIYWIPGNHEYYNFYFKDADAAGAEFARILDPRLQILNNETVELDDNNVLIASTLWTDFNNSNPIDMEIVRSSMNDYNEIALNKKEHSKPKTPFTKKMKLTPEHILKEHKNSLNFIKTENEKYSSKRRVVVTHHAISDRSISPNFHSSTNNNSGYYTRLDDWISDSGIQVWIHGHTHHDVNYTIGSTRILGKMHGYGYFERKKDDPITFGRIEI